MKLTMIEPLPHEPTKMQHTFNCECGNFNQLKFVKATLAQGIYPCVLDHVRASD